MPSQSNNLPMISSVKLADALCSNVPLYLERGRLSKEQAFLIATMMCDAQTYANGFIAYEKLFAKLHPEGLSVDNENKDEAVCILEAQEAVERMRLLTKELHERGANKKG